MTSILITGGAGFIGQELAAVLAQQSDISITLTDLTQPPVPPTPAGQGSNVTFNCVASDLTNPEAVATIFAQRYSAVYTLHGLMSGGSEANLELGLRVNLDSHRQILDFLRKTHPGTKVIFPSSLAVYGPTGPGEVVSELTCPIPQSSYGAEKLIVETLVNDYSRRGLLDGRVVRLPTVVVRPGAPSAAASSFASGIIREPLRNQASTLPVPLDLEMWVASPATVVKNLIAVKDVPAEKFGLWRTVNLPGITVTVREMLDALEAVGGKDKRALVTEERDEKIEKIVCSWPSSMDTSRAQSMGLAADVPILETVKAFAKSEGLL
ncbi:hypothetical protein MCOR27_004209 [Pyricularia oryzae]|uniref:NAD-dependent epimerase/dehydratase domain-containing protein n=4 Tax=Pyricularia TaxID=48558 RepID=A0ABQ8NGI4_PYRGI|nr:hypothetical protein OOU_Y34scaffold00685g8 [Pyricularia oryzae Y34]KAH8844753.1 hypothetical protein MCOR01_002020 [Pyricularia oryzae]KAI6296734.1 hypothetical protein MCOR33_006779 [Pyricularia grisea]KAH9429398.1 hypothetical protein MCOR02_010803 [Pyricularia oryzae]KAI6254506.1 hypothetical protein MCOR19_008987 [Pyricularia oryzae]